MGWIKRIEIVVGMVVLTFAALFFYYLISYLIHPEKSVPQITGKFTVGVAGLAAGAGEASGSENGSAVRLTDYIGVNRPSLGNPDAPIKIVEFGDFECPYTREAFPAIRRLMLKYPDKIYFQFREFPLTGIHAKSYELALAAECANSQGKFWGLHDKFFLEAPENLDENFDVEPFALRSGLDMEKFRACMSANKFKNEIDTDLSKSLDLGLRGTPTFIINGYKIEGALTDGLWDILVRTALEKS